MSIAQRASAERGIDRAGPDGVHPVKCIDVKALQEPLGLGEAAGEDDDVALEGSSVFQRDLSGLNRLHVAVGLDEDADFVQGGRHPPHQPGPALANKGQPPLLQGCIAPIKPRNTGIGQQRSPCRRSIVGVSSFERSAQLGRQADVVSWPKRPYADHVKAVHSRTGEHHGHAADLLDHLHQRTALEEQMEAVAKGRTVNGLRRRTPAQSVGAVQHHHVMTGRDGVKGSGQAGDTRTNHRHSCHDAAMGCG